MNLTGMLCSKHRHKAAKELAIGYATLKRLLDARIHPAEGQAYRH